MKNQKGQVILILILVMTVALAIGISVIQRSLSDVSTSTKVEQSSRAFSAAEAGLEKALSGDTSGVTQGSFENKATAQITEQKLIPCIPGFSGCDQKSGVQQLALEYDSLRREDVSHIWLADPNSPTNPPSGVYEGSGFDVYWGDPADDTDLAALEVTLVYYGGESNNETYKSAKWFLDQPVLRAPENRFVTELVNCGSYTPVGSTKSYRCKRTIDFYAAPSVPSNIANIYVDPNITLMLVRVRLLYNNKPQPFAIQAIGTCGLSCSFPPQKRVLTSTGTAGQTQRTVRVEQEFKVVPPYLDYAIFSAGSINK